VSWKQGEKGTEKVRSSQTNLERSREATARFGIRLRPRKLVRRMKSAAHKARRDGLMQHHRCRDRQGSAPTPSHPLYQYAGPSASLDPPTPRAYKTASADNPAGGEIAVRESPCFAERVSRTAAANPGAGRESSPIRRRTRKAFPLRRSIIAAYGRHVGSWQCNPVGWNLASDITSINARKKDAIGRALTRRASTHFTARDL